MRKSLIVLLFGIGGVVASHAGELYVLKNENGDTIFDSRGPLDSFDGYTTVVSKAVYMDEPPVFQPSEEAIKLAKRPDARIGMTAKQVREQTNWGKPNGVRRTITARGVSEQWIYNGYQYLYFDNGKLTTIQQ